MTKKLFWTEKTDHCRKTTDTFQRKLTFLWITWTKYGLSFNYALVCCLYFANGGKNWHRSLFWSSRVVTYIPLLVLKLYLFSLTLTQKYTSQHKFEGKKDRKEINTFLVSKSSVFFWLGRNNLFIRFSLTLRTDSILFFSHFSFNSIILSTYCRS